MPLELPWLLSIGLGFTFIGLPIQRVLLVLWVRGSDAYFHQGIRVLKGKPVRFSDGQLVPTFPDFIAGMAMFLIIGLIATGLYLLCLRFQERREPNHSN